MNTYVPDYCKHFHLYTLDHWNLMIFLNIKKYNWITNGVNIRKGKTIIMNDTVIAANSFVNAKFINSNIIIAGQPAKVVKENIVWSREKL